jgi:putative spermidine/putrescine transport system permease protein
LSRRARERPSEAFRFVTFPAGAQNTLLLRIFGKIRLGQQLPQVNVLVAVINALTIIPVYFVQRLSHESGILRRR